MQPEALSFPASHQHGASPVVLSEIFSATTSVVRWQRTQNKVIKAYFDTVAPTLGQGIRQVFPVDSLRQDLDDILPDALGKAQAIEDVHLLADMLTCLFDCSEVGLRLAAVDRAMCPRFHVDNIPVRLITTYSGPGTQWLPNELAAQDKLGHASRGLPDDQSGLYADAADIQSMQTFDVGLLKGAVFGEDHPAAIHRSCLPDAEKLRVLLTLDPI